MTNEENFIVNQYHDSWLEASTQFVIKSEVFLKDLLNVEHDFQSFGRCHASVKSMNFSRVQALLNSQCGVQNSISMISLINCNFLYVARMSSSLALTMKSIICESGSPETEGITNFQTLNSTFLTYVILEGSNVCKIDLT